LFLLANVVDDIDQGITHVIRGEDHLPNTPKQQMLWEALGHPPPVWAHLPMIVNQKRQKLSKRRDKVALEDYRDLGYLPEVMRTYLMLLGWTPPGGREVLPWDVIEAEFSLKDVNSGSAFFDDAKLRSLNGDYIRRLPLAEFIKVCQPWLAPPMAPWLPEAFDPHYFDEVAALAQTRISLLSEITSYVDFLFLDEPVFDRSTWEKTMYPAAERVLAASISQLATAC
jgi:glutamyl-tRNA synthetase